MGRWYSASFGSNLARLIKASTCIGQLPRADLDPQDEMSPSVDWSKHLIGVVLAWIVLKLLQERLNQT